MSKLFCMAVPVLPGKEEECRQFGKTLMGKRNEEFKASRKSLGVHERTFYQSTPHGDFVIVSLEGESPEKAFQDFVAADNEFTRWFAAQVKLIHGFDLTQPPPGPLPTLMADSGA